MANVFAKVMPGLARTMIARFGIAMVYRQVESNEYDPSLGKAVRREVSHEVYGVLGQNAKRSVTNGKQAREIMLSSDLPFTPALGDSIDVGDRTFKIVEIEAQEAGVEVAMYTLRVES